jgi:restriction-modification enzyme MmeI-like protein
MSNPIHKSSADAGPREQRFVDFQAWVTTNVTGDEKGEAQLFLDRLFKAFGWPGLREAGAVCELRVKKQSGDVSFADLVLKPVVLIEMKRRGEKLEKHYRQAFDYWVRCVPGRPRYVVLCNFDEFWIYDFETQMDVPVDIVALGDLPSRYGPLAFLFPKPEVPIFGTDHERVTRHAADRLARCFTSLVAREIPREAAQRFVLQTLITLFSEDIGLLPRYTFTKLLEECEASESTYDLLGGLFAAMNTKDGISGGRFKGIPYFNGGIFSAAARVDLDETEFALLQEAASFDWSQVRPEIFGTLFEHSLGQAERHAFGAHFTSPVDIMKIVGPTIVEPWREAIETATTLTRLTELLNRIEQFTVLDPACGSGNFLYIAYRELKRLEARIYERMAAEFKSVDKAQRPFGFVTTRNFFGIDINPFAVEIAKVTMMLAHKLAIDELHSNENALPLDNLDTNFLVGDALMDRSGKVAMWPRADVIIGNPPFLGAKRMKPERGDQYVNDLRRLYPDVSGLADYCVYWFRRAHEALEQPTTTDPFRGRAGLVGTQNIRNNKSREAGLDYIADSGTIVDAVENQPWSGEANVHVSIVNWAKTKDPKLLPKKKRLWAMTNKQQTKTSRQPDLGLAEIDSISSSLTGGPDISKRRKLLCNTEPKRCFQGKIPGYDGFLVDQAGRSLILDESMSESVVVPYLTGRELLGTWKISRWAIDFGGRALHEAAAYKRAFAHCKEHVLPEVQAKYDASIGTDMEGSRREHLSRWWQFWNRRDELTGALRGLKRYIGCSRVTRRPIMVFLANGICPSDLVQVFAFDDDYSFGVLQSGIHFEWFKTSSRMKVESDLRYSVREVFETFPWPQAPSSKQVLRVVSASRDVRAVRQRMMQEMSGGLREIYQLTELPGSNILKDAQAALDIAVLECYGLKTASLTDLLLLNQDVFSRQERGVSVTAPGIPPGIPRDAVISIDCMTE